MAAMPSSSGMAASSSTMSGWWVAAWAMATRPSLASSTTTNRSSYSMAVRRRTLMSGSSSTISTVAGTRAVKHGWPGARSRAVSTASPPGGARPRPGRDLADVEVLPALAAHDDGVHVVVAAVVVQEHGRPFRSAEPAAPPGVHGGEHAIGVAALVGQPVLGSRRRGLVLDAVEHTLGDEALEPEGEHVATDAEVALEVVEAAGPEARLPDQQHVPVIAEDVGAAGDVARPVGRVRAPHAGTSGAAASSFTSRT